MCVCVADCPEVTHVGLRYFNSSSKLTHLILRDQTPYWLTDDKLQALHGYTSMKQLELGYNRQMNITAAAVTRSVRLHTHTGRCMPTP